MSRDREDLETRSVDSEAATEDPELAEVAEEEERGPRLEITKGRPWVIDEGQRAKWSAPEFVAAHALDIRQVGDPVLHAPARKPRLSVKDMEALVAQMFASMVKAHGIGIAAPQIGVPLRVAIIDVDSFGVVVVNPVIEAVSEEVEETSEGCLSVRGLYAMLERPIEARLSAEDIRGSRFTLEGVELGAQCMLHETQHLEGALYIDKLRSRADLKPVEKEMTSVSGHSREEMEAPPSR
ncbi:MAG: peptide deformylase [Chloroflexi bacterium]|nr:peptide deformylase [Chloroflexota bacterium]